MSHSILPGRKDLRSVHERSFARLATGHYFWENQNSPIITSGGRADAENDAVKVQLAHVWRFGP